MASNLFIIEAPGKRKSLANVLWHAGLKDVEVLATVGHIGTNPDGFKPIAIDEHYRELAYRLKPEKERLAADIARAASAAKKVFIATDDDQEGDVIARDVLRFCLNEEDRSKVLRVRLRALVPTEVKSALAEASIFDELSATRGDTRRIVDRLIGALSNDEGAVGRVQGSLLLVLQEQQPVVGVRTLVMSADDDKGNWVAMAPLYAGQQSEEQCVFDEHASAGRSQMATIGGHVMNHNQILLSASLATGQSIGAVSGAMQALYERGLMTYPRSADNAISRESFRRLEAMAKISGAGFDVTRFKALREMGGEHTHEAPSSTAVDLPLNRDLSLLPFEEQVLVHISRNLIDCGIPCQFETPSMASLARLPDEVAGLRWHRVVPTGERLWATPPIEAGVKGWTHEQSLLHLMTKNGLGRPSTVVDHVSKFLGRGLVDDDLSLTRKGQAWSAHVGALFRHQNISKLIENYIDNNKKPSSQMVAEIVELCGLSSVGAATQQQGLDYDEEHAFSPGDFS